MVAPSCRRTHTAGCRTRVGARQMSQCHSRELPARVDVELGEHRPQVSEDGVDRDEEDVGSGPVLCPSAISRATLISVSVSDFQPNLGRWARPTDAPRWLSGSGRVRYGSRLTVA